MLLISKRVCCLGRVESFCQGNEKAVNCSDQESPSIPVSIPSAGVYRIVLLCTILKYVWLGFTYAFACARKAVFEERIYEFTNSGIKTSVKKSVVVGKHCIFACMEVREEYHLYVMHQKEQIWMLILMSNDYYPQISGAKMSHTRTSRPENWKGGGQVKGYLAMWYFGDHRFTIANCYTLLGDHQNKVR